MTEKETMTSLIRELKVTSDESDALVGRVFAALRFLFENLTNLQTMALNIRLYA